MVSHPDYPALSALAETLDELGILYNAVIFEEKGNPNITFPFLAHSPQKEGGFEIISSKKHYQKIKSAFFKKMGWDGYNGKSSSGHKK